MRSYITVHCWNVSINIRMYRRHITTQPRMKAHIKPYRTDSSREINAAKPCTRRSSVAAKPCTRRSSDLYTSFGDDGLGDIVVMAILI